MPTWTALTTLADRDKAEALAERLEEIEPEPYGVGAFEMEDGSGLWEIGGYFTEAPDEVALALLAAAHGAKSFTVSELPETDWVAKVRRELAPVEAGRFWLYGSHDADSLPDDKVSLLIEAAMAFGTGHHGTTQGCLTAFDRLLNQGFATGPVADIGCGTAVLAMAAAKVWDIVPVASDIDPVAVEVALANAAANGLEGRIHAIEATGFDHPDLAGHFRLIFANILKGPLIDLAPDMGRAVAPAGAIILSGLLNDQAGEVRAAYEAEGFALDDHLVLGDWSTLTMIRAA
ncbi:50S ribosomal protein L11 methyltransferase [Mangrovicoccus algicola]|uniref:Ribosomal protein L11 methyltransferase n=1 Tax=Mangrovicoccus algicola TaxID=2771008 RepID=A0A8J6Z4V1_9RHOB|nr:50S ribosomal protein L11 methyltransferase [Mangrovicoccus algicola]MBE3637689.1 50S ribosomal protein L11 methyltransferase [Mangrovicoccus algicola]